MCVNSFYLAKNPKLYNDVSISVYSMKNISCLIFIVFFVATNCFAKSDIKFLEGQLTFEGKKRSGKLTVFNQGDQPATAEVVFKKQIIYPDGRKAFENVDFDYHKYPYNVDITKFLKISPRRITLDPKRKQTFRVFLRKPPDLADGEYRIYAFLEVKELVSEQSSLDAGDQVALDIKVGVSLGIPIVIYQGELTGRVEEIMDVNISPLPKDRVGVDSTHMIKVKFRRSGNSSMGRFMYLKYQTARGKEKQIYYHAITMVPDNDEFTFIGEFDPGVNLDDIPAGSLKFQLYDKAKENILLEKVVN